MKSVLTVVLIFVLAAVAFGLPNAPTPQRDNQYAAGFSTDNMFYALQGWGVSSVVGMVSNRPWLGALSGFGSCALYRGIHIQGYHNDKFWGDNRMEFCAAGSAVSYGMMKVMHVGRKNKQIAGDK